MKKLFLNIVLGVFVLLVLLIVVGVQAIVGWRELILGPRARPLTALKIEATPERLERGRYLATARHGCTPRCAKGNGSSLTI